MIDIPARISAPAVLCALLGAVGGCAKDDSLAYSGSELYAGNCSTCHGVYADGMGPASSSIPQLVPDLRQIAASNGGVFPRELVRRIIDGRDLVAAHADDVMPKWGNEFQIGEGYSDEAAARVEAKVTALVDFIETLQIKED